MVMVLAIVKIFKGPGMTNVCYTLKQIPLTFSDLYSPLLNCLISVLDCLNSLHLIMCASHCKLFCHSSNWEYKYIFILRTISEVKTSSARHRTKLNIIFGMPLLTSIMLVLNTKCLPLISATHILYFLPPRVTKLLRFSAGGSDGDQNCSNLNEACIHLCVSGHFY